MARTIGYPAQPGAADRPNEERVMSVGSDVRETHAATEQASTANPALLGLPTFLPGGITLGLWLVGYLDTAALPGGMVAATVFSSGLFLLVACVWAARVGQSAVAGVLGTFSAFWLSFGFLVMGLVNSWFGISADAATAAVQVQNVQSTFVLAWLIAFLTLTVATLRMPLAFTAGFVFVSATFALVYGFVQSGNALFATLGGITTFVFCAIYAYIFLGGMSQELGGRALPMGNPIQR
jgi:succinate-acetate transporter protein